MIFHPSMWLCLGIVSTVRGYLDIYPPVDENDPRTPLHFALLQSFGGDFNGSGSVAGLQVALDRINSEPSLLPGYSLHYTLTDSQCNRTVALNAFFEQIILGPAKVALIGSGCSVATEPTAEISHYYNITHISCVSSSTELANRGRFRYYFQLLPTEADLAPVYFGIIRQYQWRRVGLIVQNENLFTVTVDRLKKLLLTINVTYTEKMFESEDSITGLGSEPFDPSVRIYIIATYAVHARPLLCEAYSRGLRYPRQLLLTPAWYAQQWWLEEDKLSTCTPQQRESVLPTSLAVLHFNFLQNNSMTTDTGITGGEYFQEEWSRLGVPPLYLSQLEYAQYCYDATWTLAYALNQTINELEENPVLNAEVWAAVGLQGNGTFPLERSAYNNSVLLDVIFRHIQRTSFSGITGPVSFDDIGIRAVNRLRVMQFRSVNGSTQLEWVEVAKVLGKEEGHAFQYLPGESEDTVWPGGLIPYDGVPLEQEVAVAIPITVVFSILATAGIVFAVICLAFNCIFRNRKLIRLSSPNLNYLIGGGAIILYIDIYFFIIPTADPYAVAALCNLTPWLTALGYSLCYGTILAKMARVYYIFSNPSPVKKKKVLKDRHLALGVLVLALTDLLILLVYAIVEGVQGNLIAYRVPNRENPMDVEGELGITTLYFIYVCNSTARDIFLGILYGYKMVLQIIALILAFTIRKVKIKGLDDSKYIAAAIYVTSIVLAVIIVSTYSLKDFINGFAALFCTGFVIGTTFILGLVFVPKMVGVYSDPHGETIFVNSNPTQQSNQLASDKDTIASLRRRVHELETEAHDSVPPSKLPSQSMTEVQVDGEGKGSKEEDHTIWDTPDNTTAC